MRLVPFSYLCTCRASSGSCRALADAFGRGFLRRNQSGSVSFPLNSPKSDHREGLIVANRRFYRASSQNPQDSKISRSAPSPFGPTLEVRMIVNEHVQSSIQIQRASIGGHPALTPFRTVLHPSKCSVSLSATYPRAYEPSLVTVRPWGVTWQLKRPPCRRTASTFLYCSSCATKPWTRDR